MEFIQKLLDFTNTSRDIADSWYTGNFELTYNVYILNGVYIFLFYSRTIVYKYKNK